MAATEKTWIHFTRETGKLQSFDNKGVGTILPQVARQYRRILFSGDVATTGTEGDIKSAHSFVDDVPARGYLAANNLPTLRSARAPISVLPGNHDRFADDWGTPNGDEFSKSFKAYLPNFKDRVGWWVDEKAGQHLTFVYADFSLQARLDATDKALTVYGQGRVYDEVLADLKDRTSSLKRDYPESPVIWLIHFAPFDCGSHLGLFAFDTLINAAVELDVLATLCGHTHRASRKTAAKEHIIYCAGSAGSITEEDDSKIHVLNIDTGSQPRIWRQNYYWDRDQHDFMPLASD